MKKLSFILAAILIFAMAGCTKDKPKEKNIENITREETEKAETPEVSSEEKGETDKAEESEKEPEKESEKEEKSEEAQPVQETKKLSEIQAEIKSVVDASGAMDLSAAAISALYGINESDMVQAIGFVVMEGTFPHEAIMIEAKDSAAADRAEALLAAKHASFVEQSKGYDAENHALAQKCKVERRGNHISMFLTPNFEAMKSVYTKYIK